MHSAEIRQKFLDFFHSKGHEVVRSSPLIPHGDPTLLFTTAGMVQFKDLFTGKEKRAYKRATSSQKCVRAGGKHNDLENVGRTARHHTFFEMLGNFSFGDYFKKEACAYAWEFLTQVLKMDTSKVHITVFGGEDGLPADTEAEEIWKSLGVPADRISRKGAEDNFWSAGDTGPCGPCTEIHFDRGQGTDEGDQMLEFWNLVFMQYDRDASGKLNPLPAPSVDTGMGLERICMVLGGFQSNYETDLLAGLVQTAAKLSGKSYMGGNSEDDVSMRVIADHSRATAFLIADGVVPSNEGRGYVLRRIMRRAIRHGNRLGLDKPFFHEVCAKVVAQYDSVYPELREASALIAKVVLQEEESFRRTLSRGLDLFKQATASLSEGGTLDGALVFKLYETYGFPADLTEVLALEKGFKIDWVGFELAKVTHEQASAGGLGLAGVADHYKELADQFGPTAFEDLPEMETEVLAVMGNELLLSKTPFYAESGGQVGDTGKLTGPGIELEVTDVKKIAGLHVHQFTVSAGQPSPGVKLKATVDWARRAKIRRHHSVTHLLHTALRQRLGEHLTQKGSLVAPDKLRFDFSHFEAISPKVLEDIESQVNAWILDNEAANVQLMSLDEAKKQGAMALFGEKYGDTVRVMDIGPHSRELCGGTHVARTGDIGSFRIISEGPLAAGVRRIEAVAGEAAVLYAQREHAQLLSAARLLGVAPGALEQRISSLGEELRSTKQELEKFKAKESSKLASEWASQAQTIHGIQVFTKKLNDVNPEVLQGYADELRNHMKSGIVVLGLQTGPEACQILVAITKDLAGKYHAGHIVAKLAEKLGGKGGGRPDFARAGGTRPELLDQALQSIDFL